MTCWEIMDVTIAVELQYSMPIGKRYDITPITHVSLNEISSRGFCLYFPQITQNVFMFSTPLRALPDLGTQPRYKAPGDLRVKYKHNAVINFGWFRLSPR